MKRQRLLLTGLGAVLTEEAKKKLEDIEEDSLSAEQRENLGLPALKEQEAALEDEDYEEVYSEVMVYVDQIQLMSGDVDATVIFLKDGITVTVTETVEAKDAVTTKATEVKDAIATKTTDVKDAVVQKEEKVIEKTEERKGVIAWFKNLFA